jgi:hypothetical protein
MILSFDTVYPELEHHDLIPGNAEFCFMPQRLNRVRVTASLLHDGNRVLSSVVKLLGRETNHSLSSSAKLYLHSPTRLHVMVFSYTS